MAVLYRLNQPGAARNVMDAKGVRVVPEAGVISGPAPRFLDRVAAECWRTIVAEQLELARVGLAWITRSDTAAVEVLCVAYARWRASVIALDHSVEERRRQGAAMLQQQGLSPRYARRKATALVSGTTLTSKSGDLIPSPFVNLELAQRKALHVALRESGFAPGVRLNLLAKLIRLEGAGGGMADPGAGGGNDHLLD